MRIINTFNISDVTYYVQDNTSLYLFRGNPPNDLFIFNISTFEIIESFPIRVLLSNISRPCVDSDCIYLPTQEGQILGIDKFSGQLLVTLDLGSMLSACNIVQDKSSIYSICAVPIMKEIQKETLLVLCINGKQTGKKRFQSSLLNGKIANLTVNENIIFTIDKILYLYSKEGHKEKSTQLNFIPDYPIMVTDKFIVCACKNGTLEIFNKSTLESSKLFVEKNHTSPIQSEGDIIYWFTNQHLYRIDLQESLISKLLQLNKTPEIDCTIHNNNLYYINKNDLVKYNISKQSIDSFDIKERIIQKPIIYKDDVLLISQHHIYQVGD